MYGNCYILYLFVVYFINLLIALIIRQRGFEGRYNINTHTFTFSHVHKVINRGVTRKIFEGVLDWGRAIALNFVLWLLIRFIYLVAQSETTS